jgi:hypothetical protein
MAMMFCMTGSLSSLVRRSLWEFFSRWLFQEICTPREKRFRRSENCFVVAGRDETIGQNGAATPQ